LPRRLARFVGVLLHLEPVLVGSGQKVYVVAAQAMPTAYRIGHDGRVRVPEVGLCGDVINRSGCRELWHLSNLRSTS